MVGGRGVETGSRNLLQQEAKSVSMDDVVMHALRRDRGWGGVRKGMHACERVPGQESLE